MQWRSYMVDTYFITYKSCAVMYDLQANLVRTPFITKAMVYLQSNIIVDILSEYDELILIIS